MSKEDHVPASLRILNLDFDSCLEHVDYNIETLSEMLTNEEKVHPFDVLNHIKSIIIDVCKLVEEPTQGHADDTFCISTRLKSCHQEDIEKLKSKLENIRNNDIYAILKNSRNKTVAHTSYSYQGYEATQEALVEVSTYLFEHHGRLSRFKKLIYNIKTLIHEVEMSIRKKEGKPLNVDSFTLKLIVRKNVSNKEPNHL